MCTLSKKHAAIGSGIVLILAVAGTVLAVYGERFEGFSEKRHGYERGFVNERNGGRDENVSRTVADTASGADITFTPASSSDTGAVSAIVELGAEFQVMKGSQGFQNSAFKADSSMSGPVLKISVTSNSPDVVRLIQEKAANGESGAFGTDLLGENYGSDVGNGGREEKNGRKDKESRRERSDKDRGERDE